MKLGRVDRRGLGALLGCLLITTVSVTACGDGDGDAGDAGDASGSETASDSGDGDGDGDGDGNCAPSATQPGIDANGMYGPCAGKDECGQGAHACNNACGGSCAQGCANDEECPAAGDYPVECRPSASGSDPTGDCIITCAATADCPAGMLCEQDWFCVWASSGG